MVRQLTENEDILLHAIAIWLRDEMVLRLAGKLPAPSSELMHDNSQSNFEISCCALERIGIFSSDGEYWRVKEAGNDQSIFKGQHTRSDLDHLLNGLACHSSYVDDLYRHYEIVKPTTDALRGVCLAMVKCGYMEATSVNAFEWTDAFGPWLVSHDAWALDEFESTPQAEVDMVLATISDDSKTLISGSLCRNPKDFLRCFFAQWIDGKWAGSEWRNVPNDDWDLCLGMGLYAKLHGK